jgi:hypothetical protein
MAAIGFVPIKGPEKIGERKSFIHNDLKNCFCRGTVWHAVRNIYK